MKHWEIIVSFLECSICLDRSVLEGIYCLSASLSGSPSISKAAMLVNKFSLPDSRCSKNYSAEELCVCDSNEVKTLSDERGKGLEKDDGAVTGKTATEALTAPGLL